MIHRLFATPNRRVIIALVTVLFVLNALVFFVVRTREMTVARLQLNQNHNKPNDLTLVTASASTDVQVTLESNIASLPAGGGDVPVKIMVSKPANTVLSALAVELKYDTSKFEPPIITSDASCNVMQPASPTPTSSNVPNATNTPIPTNVPSATNTPIPTNVPNATNTPVPSPAVAQAVSAGYASTCAIKTGGRLYCWGDVSDPKTIVPATVTNAIAVSVGVLHTCAIQSGGHLYCWGDNSYGQTTIPAALTNAIAVSAGGAHTCAIQSGGQLYCWGHNANGQIVVPATVTNAIAVSVGGGHSCAIQSGGQLYCWGFNGYGQTTIPSSVSNVIALSASYGHTCAIQSGGQLSCWGYNSYGQTTVPATVTNAIAVSAGGGHTCAIQSGGQLSCWGYNYSGQISVPSSVSNVIAVSGGSDTSCAIQSGGQLYCWGGIAVPAEFTNVLGASTQARKDGMGLTLVGASVLGVNDSPLLVSAVQKTSGDTQAGTTNFCLAKATFKTKAGFTTLADTGRIEVVASGGDTRIETLPVSGTTMGTVEGQQYVEVTKADPGYTIASPAYDVRMTGTVALTIKKPDDQIKRGDEFYIDIMAKPTVPEGAFVGMSALEFDFGYGAAIGADGVPTSKVFITKFDTLSSSDCTLLEHVLPVVTDGYTVASQRPTIRYSKAGHNQATIPTTDFCVGRIYMKAMETGLVQMSIKTGDDAVALDARGRKMTIQNTNGIASSISLDVVPSTIVDPSCEDLRLNVDTNDQQTYVRPQQAVVISMNTGLAYKILADKGAGITLKNPPKRFTYTAPAEEGPDRIQIWRTDNTYCEPEITVQSNANGSVSSLDGVFIDPNKVSVRMKIRPQGVIKGRLPYTKLKVAIAAGGLPTSNNLIDPVSNEFVSIGDGMFEGIVTFDPRYIKPGKGYKLIVKGSKHLAKRICEPEPNKSKTKPDSAYSCPKDNAGVFEFKNGLNGPYDFTKVYLPAGDLFIDRQDGVIDSTDLTYIRKHLGSQDPELLRVGDINMDGQIDTQDYLITISNVVNNLDEN